jgi:DNA repair protein RadD
VLVPRDYQQECADKAIAHMRQTDEPGVIVATTAAGKSVITTVIANVVNKAGKRVLCLAPNADLVSDSASKYRLAGGKCSIFSASLNQKHTGHPVVFGTPLSVANSLDQFGDEYALLLIDECSGVSDEDATTYQKIISHMVKINPKLRICGLEAVPARGKNKLIGPDNTFKHIIHELPHHVLSSLGWVVPYRLGHVSEHYDLAKVKVQSNGKFKQSDIDDETLNKERLSRAIVADFIGIMEADKRNAAIIFASTIKHANEIVSYLPEGQVAIVTGKTTKGKNGDRPRIIKEAREGKWRYLVTVNALGVGTDIPIIDTVIFMRAFEVIRPLIQGMGRSCRLWDDKWALPPAQMNWLHESYQGKRDALVLDFGQNLERFALDDDLTITGLVKAKNKDDADEEFFEVECPDCNTTNKHTAQRCVGIVDGTRCSYRFIYKECDYCQTQNSPSARHCWKCGGELIDPNAKLTRKAAIASGTPFFVQVLDMSLQKHQTQNGDSLRVSYQVTDGEKKWAVSEFQRPGHENPFHRKRWHYFAEDTGAIGNTIENVLLEAGSLKVPSRLLVKKPKGKKYYEIEARHS